MSKELFMQMLTYLFSQRELVDTPLKVFPALHEKFGEQQAQRSCGRRSPTRCNT